MHGKDLAAPRYTGIMQTMFLVTREEGLMALWKGNGANVLRVIPVYGLKFAFNDSFKAIVAGPGKKRLDTHELLWVGTLAGLFQTILTYPLETVRTRLSLGTGQGVQYRGIADCFREMVKTEGVAGLYKGIGPTMVTGAPYTGIQMTGYELMQRYSADYRKNLWVQLFNGAMAGLIAQTLTYPGDTIRRRMQNNGAGGAPRIYRNSFHCTSLIMKNEGASGGGGMVCRDVCGVWLHRRLIIERVFIFLTHPPFCHPMPHRHPRLLQGRVDQHGALPARRRHPVCLLRVSEEAAGRLATAVVDVPLTCTHTPTGSATACATYAPP